MPPRDPSLPEGTDHIIDTNIDLGDSGASGGSGGGSGAGSEAGGGETSGSGSSAGATGQSGGAQSTGGQTGSKGAQGGGNDGGSAFKFDKDQGDGDKSEGVAAGIAGQIKDQISGFRSQATDRVRSLADDGKAQATSFLQSVAEVLSDAAGSIEDKLGEQYAGPGNSASDSIRSLAGRLDESSVEDLFEGAKSFVQKSPVLAIGVAAVVGFAVARVVRSSVAEFRASGDEGSQSTGGASGATAA